MERTRRSFFKKLGILPLIAPLKPAHLLGESATLSESDRQRQRLAVQVLRFINTAELWHSVDYGSYLNMRDLRDSRAVADLRKSEKAEKIGQGRSLIEALAFEEAEVVPGWELQQHLSDNGQGYVMVLTDKSSSHLGTFSTDERGIISKVEPIGSIQEGLNPELAAAPPGIYEQSAKTLREGFPGCSAA